MPGPEWISEEPAAGADDLSGQADTVVLPDPEPFWSMEDAPTPEAAPVEGEVVQAHAEPFWHAIEDDHEFAAEISDNSAEQGLPEAAVESDELVEAAVAADHDLAAETVEAFWCPEDLLVVADANAESVDELEDLVPDWSRDLVAGAEIETIPLGDVDVTTAEPEEAEDLLIEADGDVLDDFGAPEWLDELDDDDPAPLPLDIQELRDRSRSAELGAALLDLAFAGEAGPDAVDSVAEAGVAVLDESAEAQFALEMFETFALECTDYVEALNLAAMQLDRNPQQGADRRLVRG